VLVTALGKSQHLRNRNVTARLQRVCREQLCFRSAKSSISEINCLLGVEFLAHGFDTVIDKANRQGQVGIVQV
jgi:hypothetical protein